MSSSIEPLSEKYYDYLRDESRMSGYADTISFPLCKCELVAAVSRLSSEKIPVTIQGARTGVTGGAVPSGGHVINLGKMKKITGLRYNSSSGRFFLSCGPGVLLSECNEALQNKEFDTDGWSRESLDALDEFKKAGSWFFTPDPTETGASIGGMVSCNASGARSFMYGPTRNHVHTLGIVFADGRTATLRRGELASDDGSFRVQCDDGSVIAGTLPDYVSPEVKNVLGYYVKKPMEPIDLFVGSDGTLGIISEIELALTSRPECVWGIVAFLPDQQTALRAVGVLRGKKHPDISFEGSIGPSALEYFNSSSLDLLRKWKKESQAFSHVPDMPSEYAVALYIEFMGKGEDEVIDAVEQTAELVSSLGGDEDACWAAGDERELERLKKFRHAVPEAVNLTIDMRRKNFPELTKLGTDMAVPDLKLASVFDMYDRDLDENGLESVIFGHIGDNHLHVNILPRNMEEYGMGKDLYMKWAQTIIDWGGTPAAEHGIGKLKKAFLKMKYSDSEIRQMIELKKIFDPSLLLSRGNWFEEEIEVME
ncbi:MAG: FAD-binding protein [Chitinivibrionales bacterium]|nr:FAD-binding protein [Chitinivibrionales bacterium]